MASKRRKVKHNTVSVDIGCCSSIKSKLSFIFFTKQKPSPSLSNNTTSCPYAAIEQSNTIGSTSVNGFGRIDSQSLAVEKDSYDPYVDFRQSMLQMIMENHIYSKDDLRDLLRCFLQLNSPYHHGIIIRAFTEIWNCVYASSPNFGY